MSLNVLATSVRSHPIFLPNARASVCESLNGRRIETIRSSHGLRGALCAPYVLHTGRAPHAETGGWSVYPIHSYNVIVHCIGSQCASAAQSTHELLCAATIRGMIWFALVCFVPSPSLRPTHSPSCTCLPPCARLALPSSSDSPSTASSSPCDRCAHASLLSCY